MRTLLFLLLPILASGQIYIDSYKFAAAPPAQLLLNAYPGAAAAYSLRLLDADYTGDCITVRRTSDNALDTFGFVNNYLDTTSLKSFCGTGGTDSCFVRIWWDQSGNGRHLKRTSSDLKQPRILTSGVIDKEGSNPSILFDGTNDNFLTDSFSLGATDYSVLFVAKSGGLDATGRAVMSINVNALNQNGFYHAVYRNNISNNFRWLFTSNGFSLNQLIQTASSTYPTTITLGSSYVPQTGTIYSFVNNTEQDSDNAIGQTMNGIVIQVGNYFNDSAYFHQGTISEIVIYNSNKYNDHLGIHSNINTFYSIY